MLLLFLCSILSSTPVSICLIIKCQTKLLYIPFPWLFPMRGGEYLHTHPNAITETKISPLKSFPLSHPIVCSITKPHLAYFKNKSSSTYIQIWYPIPAYTASMRFYLTIKAQTHDIATLPTAGYVLAARVPSWVRTYCPVFLPYSTAFTIIYFLLQIISYFLHLPNSYSLFKLQLKLYFFYHSNLNQPFFIL